MLAVRSAAAVAASLLALALPGCTTSTGPATPTPVPATSAASPSVPSPSASSTAPAPPSIPATPTAAATPKSPPPSPVEDPQALQLAITIAGGQVEPNGDTIPATVGQQIQLSVTSDIDDEIHAHTSSDGFELSVPAGETVSGSFRIGEPGRYEVESHALDKVIVILNVR